MTTPTVFRGTAFPVRLTMPDGEQHATCRLSASSQGVTVWEWSHTDLAGVPVIEAGTVMSTGRDRWAIDLGEDGIVAIEKQDGCACSHPMKRWRPPGPAKS